MSAAASNEARSDAYAPTICALDALVWACRRDLRLSVHGKSELALVLVFFVLVTSMFPLGVGPEPGLLRAIAPGIVWVCALLASLLSFGRLFGADYADGTLEQMVVSGAPLAALAAGKMLGHVMAIGVPLALLTPLIALQFGLSVDAMVVAVAALLLGTPILVGLGAIGAALTLGVRGGATLLALLVLPLAVPVLIFGAGAIEAAEAGMSASAHLSLLGAGLILAALGCPFATAAALRIALE
ncbi:MAG: heme exporter protein CcmB [Casimicrobiaceae bacterium]